MLELGHHVGADAGDRGRLRNPRRARVDIEIDGAREAYGAQNVGKNVHAFSYLYGRARRLDCRSTAAVPTGLSVKHCRWAVIPQGMVWAYGDRHLIGGRFWPLKFAS